MTEKEFEEF